MPTSEFEKEIAKFPPAVQAVMRAYPPTRCYREHDRPQGHYWICSYLERPNGVHLTLLHGSDSFTPGMAVHGVAPESLQVCDCGQWREATEDQLYYIQEHITALHLARCGAARPRGAENIEAHRLREKLTELHRVGCALMEIMDAQAHAGTSATKAGSEAFVRVLSEFRFVHAILEPRARAQAWTRSHAEPYILCKACSLRSTNPYDIGLRYCGKCHKFHEGASDYELGPAS